MLDVAAVRAERSEHVRQPLSWVILKVAQRCNLDCSYCYVYNRGDISWRERPAVISTRVVEQLSKRIAEHCVKYAIDRFTVELHGGEPLLIGKRRMRELVEKMRAAVGPVNLRFILQTNGTLLDVEWLELFGQLDISFGGLASMARQSKRTGVPFETRASIPPDRYWLLWPHLGLNPVGLTNNWAASCAWWIRKWTERKFFAGLSKMGFVALISCFRKGTTRIRRKIGSDPRLTKHFCPPPLQRGFLLVRMRLRFASSSS